MSNEIKYALLKKVQRKTKEALLKDLENRHIYTGHSLHMRTLNDVKKDIDTFISNEIDKANQFLILMS